MIDYLTCRTQVGRLHSILVILLFFSTTSFSQTILVQLVDNLDGEPLIGVNVFTDDYETFTGTTDFDGKIEIPRLGHRDVINFSYIGYTTVSFPFYEIRTKGIIRMVTDQTGLDTLVIVGRKDEKADEIPYLNERITAAQIAFQNPQTTADALERQTGVFIQRSQMGGGSPILRGFEANRVLLVVDGVRMNNAIYRSGHLQNSISIDNSILEQMEVIYGPGSLTYGSDAIGGVVHFRTRDPKLLFGESDKEYRMNSNFYTRFSSANFENTFHYDLDYGNRKWGSLTSATFSRYDDLRAGSVRPEAYPNLGKQPFAFIERDGEFQVNESDPDLQQSTGYNQIDFLQKFRIQPNDNLYFVLNGQYSTTTDVPRYDRLNDTLSTADKLVFAEWYYGPQERVLTSFKTRVLGGNSIFTDATFIASYQKIDEDRISRKSGRDLKSVNSEDVQVFGLTLDFNKEIDESGQHLLSYGAEGNYNDVKSLVVEENRITGVRSIGRELSRYPSAGSQLQSLGAYLNYRWANSAKTLFLNAGARYTDITVKAKYDTEDSEFISWPEEYYSGISNRNSAISWAGGVTWNAASKWQIRANASKAFRAPNIDDLFKNRIKNNKAVLPNENLAPETSFNGELTLAKTFGEINTSEKVGVKLSGTGFYTILNDVIVRRDNGLQIEGESGNEIFDIQQNFNAYRASVFGFSGNTEISFGKKVMLSGGVNFTKGETTFKVEDEGITLLDTIAPLDHIPPTYGRGSLTYKGEFVRLEAVVRFNAAKVESEYSISDISLDPKTMAILEIDRTGTSDNLLETGTCSEVLLNGVRQHICGGSPGWITYNFYASFKLGKFISLDLAAENLLDTHYRNFGSGISAPGRNFITTFRAKF